MRSSKSRSRGKNNRNNRSVANMVNRVFDSSGPEGKVRGTPQQIIDKYNQLARDAQLANDRVAAENFQQHAEHYLRLLSEAQREQEARREQQDRERQQERDDRQQERDARRDQNDQQDNRRYDNGDDGQAQPAQPKPEAADAVIETEAESEGSTLVETPEDAPKPKQRRPRKPKAEAQPAEGDAAPKPKARRPRKPKADDQAKADAPATPGPDASEAAE